MFDVEDRHWWYLGLRAWSPRPIARLAGGKADFSILDAGCGTGKLLEACASYRSVGLELSPDAFPFLRRRGLENVVRGSVVRMPFPDETFDLVVSNDVLCCVETPGDLHALLEMGRVLRTGGNLLLNLPAYEFMRSHHDAAVHTKQRYTRPRLRAMLARAGFGGADHLPEHPALSRRRIGAPSRETSSGEGQHAEVRPCPIAGRRELRLDAPAALREQVPRLGA